MRLFALVLALLLCRCSLLLDFEDESDLPCPCLPSHVCLQATNRCVLRGSVDLKKSCALDAENPDDLCPEGAACVDVRGRGPRCLRVCNPSNYSVPESGAFLLNQCGAGQICWPSERIGGACDDGECRELPNNCPPPQQCVFLNGAGVCFTPCQLRLSGNDCAGDQLCHPVANSPTTACLAAGSVEAFQPCDDTLSCRAFDQTTVPPRPLVCDVPAGKQDIRRCLPLCSTTGQNTCVSGEQCVFARSSLNVCDR